MAKPLVSVILPCYREPLHWFRQAIESITQQSLKDLEIIVVIDDRYNVSLRITNYFEDEELIKK